MKTSNRIIMNAGVMYGQMFISIVVSLYTSRIILQALGEIDFGIYSVIGGVVTMFNFLNASMATSSQRFITFELGKPKDSNVRKIFSSSVFNHLLMAVIIFLIVEVIGLWFFERFINVPESRLKSAIFIFHFSAINFVFSNITVPFRALIIAKEKMHSIAFFDTLRILIKLGAVIYLQHAPYDKLKAVGLIFCAISFIIFLAYWLYCRLSYKESKLSYEFDKKLFKELFSFGFFSLLGNLSRMGKNQGYAILVNIFFGPLLNAAFGVANQVNTQLKSLTRAVVTAVNPQLTKRYAGDKIKEMKSLLYKSSKIMFLILFALSIPLLFDTDYILKLWLEVPPQHASIILKLIIISIVVEVLTHPMYTLILATGKVKLFLTTIGVIIILNIPISYIFLKIGYSYTVIFIVNIIAEIFVLLSHMYFASKLAELDLREYFSKVIMPLTTVVLIAITSSFLIYTIISKEAILSLIARIAMSTIITLSSMYFIGFNKKEKEDVNTLIYSILRIAKKKLGRQT